MKTSIHIATVHRIPIEVNYTWFIIFGLVIFTLARFAFPVTSPGLAPLVYWLMAIIAALLLFACLLLHELAHSIVAQHHNLPIHSITLFVFGGVARMEKEPESPKAEFQMAIAGPLMSFFLAGFFWALTYLFYFLKMPLYFQAITGYLFLINTIVAIFNLIPGFPLDGGRVLRSILWHYTKNLRRATRIASNLGKIFAFMLIGFGLLLLFSRNIISGVWFIFIGLFLQEAADVSYKQVVMKGYLHGLKVTQIMTKNVVCVPADIDLEHLVQDYFFSYRHTAFPVVENDKILGLITLHDIKEVTRDKWAQMKAKQIMVPLTPHLVIAQNSDAIDALGQITRSELGRLLVMEDGKLVGIISQKDILSIFKFKAQIDR